MTERIEDDELQVPADPEVAAEPAATASEPGDDARPPDAGPSPHEAVALGLDAAAAPAPARHTVSIKLARFEGPLDLLLHLIKRDEIEITDIPISHITQQYLAYIELMRAL